jgi:phosphate transport system substrate-binding protein
MVRTNVLVSKRLSLGVVLLLLGMAPALSEEKIVLDGSSGMLPLARVLATAYQQKSPSPEV